MSSVCVDSMTTAFYRFDDDDDDIFAILTMKKEKRKIIKWNEMVKFDRYITHSAHT